MSRAIYSVIDKLSAKRGVGKALAQARAELNPDDFPGLIAGILNRPTAAAAVFPARLTQDPLVLYQVEPPPPVRLRRELTWAASYLARHATLLSAYYLHQEAFNAAFLRGDWESADGALAAANSVCGVSIWEIRSRIALLQASHGLDAQKRYAAFLKRNAPQSSVPAYLIHYTSVRNEPALSASRYVQLIERRLRLDVDSDGLAALLRFHLNPATRLPTSHLASVLAHGVRGSLIDYFENFVAVLRQLGATSDGEDLTSALRHAEAIGQLIGDARLLTLAKCLAGGEGAAMDGTEATALSAVLEDAAHSSSLDQDALTSAAKAPGVLLIPMLGSSAPSLDAGSPPGIKLATFARTLILSGGDDSQAADSLHKSYLNFAGTPWADASELIALGASNDADRSAPTLLSLLLAQPYASPLLSLVGKEAGIAAPWSPTASTLLPAVAWFFAAIGDAESPTEPPESVIAEWRTFGRMTGAFASGLVDDAISHALLLLEDSNAFRRTMAVRLIGKSLLGKGDLAALIGFCADSYVKDGHSLGLFPLADALAALDRHTRQALAGDLAMPIFLDMVARHGPDEDLPDLAFATEDFLSSQGLSRPSELAPRADAFRKDFLIYFLKNICVESVLDVSTAYSGSRDLADERLNVCRLLIDLDPAHSEVYQAEISAIHRRLLIEERSREVEQSRVFVDLDGIRRTGRSRWASSYARYRALRALTASRADQDSVLRAIEQQLDSHSATRGQLLSLPEDEATAVLAELLNEIKDTFATSPDFGLDSYLSVRIRHGTLSGYLRRPLESYHLLTTRASATGAYQPNTYWSERLALDERAADSLSRRLGAFSEAFDAHIADISANWIRVRTPAHPRGLFDFELFGTWAPLVEVLVSQDLSFEEFLETVLGLLTRHLELLLSSVRDILAGDARPSAAALLTNLHNEMETLHGEGARPLFSAITNARTELHQAFDRVIEWFRLPPAAESVPVRPHDAAEVAVESLRTVHPQFTVDIVTDTTDMLIEMRGTQFQNFVHIFLTLLRNVIERSGVEHPSARLEVTLVALEDSSASQRVAFTLTNPISVSAASDAAKGRLARIREGLAGGDFRSSMRAEGGTGLHKIWNLLATDFTTNPDLRFDIDEHALSFVVTFSLKFSPSL